MTRLLVQARVMHARSLWRGLLRDLFDPYRPERHYMRGPGPRWRAKHGFDLPSR